MTGNCQQWLVSIVLGLMLVGAGCSDKKTAPVPSEDTMAPKDGSPSTDTTPPSEDTTVPPEDSGPAGTDTSTPPEDTATPPNCEEGVKGAGCPCENNDECASSYCYTTNQGKTCAELCDDSCPEGFACSAIQSAGTGGDPVYLCIQRALNLCKPCSENSDCQVPGFEGKDSCIDYGDEGSFCGMACSEDTVCPSGYDCTEGQCKKADGVCECAPLYIELESATECAVTNALGTCKGTRTCEADGLGKCSALIPEKDGCDAIDNDCDGTTDEDCTIVLRGHLMGDGFTPGSKGPGFTMRGSLGTPRFVGTSEGGGFKLKAGLPTSKKP